MPEYTTPHNHIEVSAFSSSLERLDEYAQIQAEVAASEITILVCEQEIALSKWKLRSCKRRHNQLSLVHRLPPEILSNIFLLVRHYWRKRACLGWIPIVSHVCSHWRSIALEFPNLWTHLLFRFPRWIPEMLKRSQMAPLRISTGSGRSNYSVSSIAALGTVLTYFPRVKKLSLSHSLLYYGTQYDTQFLKLVMRLPSTTPILETCKIRFGFACEGNMIPETALKDAPRLTRLVLKNCGINWMVMAASMPNLKSLSISSIPLTRQPHPREVISALSKMIHLENIVLEECTNFGSTEADVSCTATARLSKLKFLKMELPLSDCAYILDHSVYPYIEYSHIGDGHRSTVYPPDAHLHIRSIRAFQYNGTPQTCSEIFYNRLPNSLSIWINDNEIQFRAAGPVHSTHRLTLHFHTPSEFSMYGLPTIIRSVSLQHLESLRVIFTAVSEADWLTLYGELPLLREIDVGWESSKFFLNALSYGLSALQESSRQESPSLKFKALRSLTLVDWSFNSSRNRGGRSRVERLIYCLRKRESQSPTLKLSNLTLEHCFHVYETWVAELEKLALCFDWDGHPNPPIDDLDDDYNSDDDDLT